MLKLATPQPARHPEPITKAQALAFLVFARPDLDKTSRFLCDFGLTVAQRTPDAIFLRSAAEQPFCYLVRKAEKPAFLGLGFEMGDRAALEALAKVEGASPIEPCPWPGGGARVRLRDPAGFEVHAVHGAATSPPLPHRAPAVLNLAGERPRIDIPQRPPMQPPEVLRLGHVVLEAVAFQDQCAWYARTFGLIPSDVQVLGDGSPVVVFMRLDLGERPADHHTVAIAQGLEDTYSHSAYEVVDADAVGAGQTVLRTRGWRHAWGVGRHILGSQIFDYWADPYGAKHEHYTDGDVFTARHPMGVHAASREAMAQWGGPMPRSFARPSLTLGGAWRVLRNLVQRKGDLSFAKLALMVRTMA